MRSADLTEVNLPPHQPDAYAECYPSYYDYGTMMEDSDEEGGTPLQVGCWWGQSGSAVSAVAEWHGRLAAWWHVLPGRKSPCLPA